METFTRKHGLQRPFHPLQVLSWVLQIFNIIAFYSSTTPCLNPNSRIPLSITFTVLQLQTIILGFIISKSDPTDSTVILFKTTHDKGLALQLEEKSEKICNFCKSPVESSSKHCVRCNRCTEKFDHHCKWINNCIGTKNYKTFICLICSCFSLKVFIGVISGKVMIDGILDPSRLENNIEDFYSMRVVMFFIVIQAVLVLEGAIISMFLAYLIGLHLILHFKGLTTYEYIMLRRNSNRVMPKDKRCDTNSALNNNVSFQVKDNNKSLSRSDADLRDSSRY